MTADEKSRLEADVATADADVRRLREENAVLAADFRIDPTDDLREKMKRGAASLAAARDRLDVARAALQVFEKTGSPHGLVTRDGKLTGTIAVVVEAGASRGDREAAIEAALSQALDAAAEELGVVLAAKPMSYTRERPGRDAERRTVLEVAGRVEGDRLVPAVSRAAKNLRK